MAGAQFTLITDSEYAESLKIDQPETIEYQTKSVLGAPQIVLVSPPTEGAALTSPIDIEVHFEAGSDASVDIKTLKIYYVLLFKKDITDRLLEHAEIGDSFVRANGATLPTGQHSFLLEIRDTLDRVGRTEISIDVGG
jgi:hypothetical protein